MTAIGVIVVRSGEGRGTYRDAHRGNVLVLDQIATDAAPELLVVGGVPVVLASVCSMAVPVPGIALGVIALGLAAGVAGTELARRVGRRARRRRASLVVAGGVLRVHRAPELEQVALELPVCSVARIEIVARGIELEGWSLVALDDCDHRHVLLETADLRAGLRVRTLLVDRLARDGAFASLETITTCCPACRARILMPEAWLPTRIACAECGAEGLLTR